MSHPSSEPAESRTAVQISNLSFSYGRTPAVVGFKWDLPSGCVAAIYGPSGAGKSTLLALLAGALPRESGTVTIWGHDPAASTGRQHLGYVPQTGGLYPGYTVEENLRTFAIGSGPHGSIGATIARTLEPFFLPPRRATLVDEAIERTLGQIQLSARRDEVVGSLSAGLQARVSLGVALLWDPHVLLLDDPLALSDDQWAAQAWTIFRERAQRGRTVLLATGRAKDALQADHVALMRAGRLLRAGRANELAPAGKASVALKYLQKTGPIVEDVEVSDLATELPGILERKPNLKPVEVQIRQDAPELRLAALLDA